MVERTRGAGVRVRDVVVLSEPRGDVAVRRKQLANRRAAPGQDPAVARKAGGHLGDHSGRRGVMVSAREQGGARGSAQRGGVELVVAQSGSGDMVQRRCRNRPPERGRGTESDVVEQDHDDVGRTGGRVGDRQCDRRGFGRGRVDDPAEPFILDW